MGKVVSNIWHTRSWPTVNSILSSIWHTNVMGFYFPSIWMVNHGIEYLISGLYLGNFVLQELCRLLYLNLIFSVVLSIAYQNITYCLSPVKNITKWTCNILRAITDVQWATKLAQYFWNSDFWVNIARTAHTGAMIQIYTENPAS